MKDIGWFIVIPFGVIFAWMGSSIPGCYEYENEKNSLQFQVNLGCYPTPEQVEKYNLSVPGNNQYWLRYGGKSYCEPTVRKDYTDVFIIEIRDALKRYLYRGRLMWDAEDKARVDELTSGQYLIERVFNKGRWINCSTNNFIGCEEQMQKLNEMLNELRIDKEGCYTTKTENDK